MTGPDSDADGISDSMEVLKGLNGPFGTNIRDLDSDGISDYQELVAIESPGGLSNNDPSIVMAWQDIGANVAVQDMFVEVDFMTATAHDHDPRVAGNWQGFQNDLTLIFASDAAFTGRTIVPHIQVSQGFTEVPRISFVQNCANSTTLDFYARKTNPAFFDPLKASAFHYVIMARLLTDNSCTQTNSSGQAEIWGNDVILTLGNGTGGVGTVAQQRGNFMHELGHNLSLVHNGNGSLPATNNSCVHSSPLNYRYSLSGTGVNGLFGMRTWSYSRGLCEASGCSNTCVVTSGRRCVPSGETSPKTGCGTSGGTCDCDVNEWNNVIVDMPSANEMSHNPCQVPGGACGAPEIEDAARSARQYFLGGSLGRTPTMRALGRRRQERLEKLGMRQGHDFIVDPNSGRTYAVE